MRETRAGIVSSIGGCYTCHGGEAHWQSRNTLAVAAKHHDATGHPVWVEQVMSVKYGSTAAAAEIGQRGKPA